MSYVQDSVLNLTCDFRAEEKAELTPVPENTLKMKAQPPDSTVTGTLMKNKFKMQREKPSANKLKNSEF